MISARLAITSPLSCDTYHRTETINAVTVEKAIPHRGYLRPLEESKEKIGANGYRPNQTQHNVDRS